jgi:CheY-like chemotaxis protein
MPTESDLSSQLDGTAIGNRLPHGTRCSKRFPTKLEVSFDNFPYLPVEQAVNISEGGVFVKTQEAPPHGSRVLLVLHLPDGERLETEALAVQIVTPKQAEGHSYPPGIGLSFAPASPQFRERLHKLLDDLGRSIPRVLVVDDDADFSVALAEALESAGMQAQTSGSGEDALRQLVDHLFELDVVLLDVRMPGMDGRAFLDRVRRLGGELDLPIILLSCVSSAELQDLRGPRGANEVLSKSASLDAIVGSIRRVLRRTSSAGLGAAL